MSARGAQIPRRVRVASQAVRIAAWRGAHPTAAPTAQASAGAHTPRRRRPPARPRSRAGSWTRRPGPRSARPPLRQGRAPGVPSDEAVRVRAEGGWNCNSTNCGGVCAYQGCAGCDPCINNAPPKAPPPPPPPSPAELCN
eukprot:6292126-Prymnesium_polylepis.1